MKVDIVEIGLKNQRRNEGNLSNFNGRIAGHEGDGWEEKEAVMYPTQLFAGGGLERCLPWTWFILYITNMHLYLIVSCYFEKKICCSLN